MKCFPIKKDIAAKIQLCLTTDKKCISGITTSSNQTRVIQLGGKLGRRKQKLEDSCCCCQGLATPEIEFYVEHTNTASGYCEMCNNYTFTPLGSQILVYNLFYWPLKQHVIMNEN